MAEYCPSNMTSATPNYHILELDPSASDICPRQATATKASKRCFNLTCTHRSSPAIVEARTSTRTCK